MQTKSALATQLYVLCWKETSKEQKIENVIAVAKGIGVTVDYLFNLGTEFEEVEAAHSEDDLTEEEIKEIREFMKKYKK